MRDRDLSSQVERYTELRQALGHQDRELRKQLEDFVRFVEAQGNVRPIRAQTAVDWACAPSPGRGLTRQRHRFLAVRGFLLYLRAVSPDTEVPDTHAVPRPPRPKPYLYSPEQIQRLMDAASLLTPRGSLRPHTYKTMIGLIASTGLRIREAIRLTTSNVHTDGETPYLEVLQTKFRKSRLVPVHPTTADNLRDYMSMRSRLQPKCQSDAFFISRKGTSCSYAAVWETFTFLKHRAGISNFGASKRACIHGLRHTFAVSRLLEWYRQGLNVNDLLPTLSTYMGHVDPKFTYWYLTATPELLGVAGEYFHNFAGQGGEQCQ
jgi:integrase/recombinase XerD